MGACVTPSQRDRYPKLKDIPLPKKSNIVQPQYSKIQTKNPSAIEKRSAISHGQLHSSTHNTISQKLPIIIEENKFIQPSSSFLIKSQSNLMNQSIGGNNKQINIPNPQFFSAVLQSPRKINPIQFPQSPQSSKQYPSETININLQRMPNVYRQSSRQQIQPQSVSNNIQKMIQTYHDQNNRNTPNFQQSAVSRLDDLHSNDDNQISKPTANVISTFHPSSQNMRWQPLNLQVDQSLLSFNKNTFQKQLITPMIKNFEYDVSLPNEKNIF